MQQILLYESKPNYGMAEILFHNVLRNFPNHFKKMKPTAYESCQEAFIATADQRTVGK